MRITFDPSPNFNARKAPVDVLVLHYTGMETGAAAIARLKDPAAEVSAHYVVREDGVVVQMVAEAERAWHAGVSRWQGDGDLNSRSVGVEIVNGGHDVPLADGTLPPYPAVQVAAVVSLSSAVLARHRICPTRVVGHSDIAPGRKRDPGEHFPWRALAQAGIGLWPEPAASADQLAVIGRGLGRGDTGTPVVNVQRMLSNIGYKMDTAGAYDEQTESVVLAFQRRWLPERLTGQADLETLARIGQVAAAYGAVRTV
ncbi:MAG: N-acetylmuramoyl-L-alanine amidase [Pseudomonadota bacterium]